MAKSDFLKGWRGNTVTPGAQNKWTMAEGSSLSECERNALKSGRIVSHDKITSLKKLFVMDEQGYLWSIIVKSDDVKRMVSNLSNVGFETIL